MGIVHVNRGRLAPALILVLAVVALFALTAGPASAYTAYQHGGAVCANCHTVDISTPPTNAQCATCHTGFTTAHAVGSTASTCWTCHTPGQDMSAVKTAAGCGSASAGAGCHNNTGHPGSTPTTCLTCHSVTTSTTDPNGSAHHKTAVTDVQVNALLTIKTSAASIKLKKTVTVSGLAKSVQPGYVVTVLVQKKGTTGKWAKVTAKAAVWTQATSSWKFTYKPTKKGAYRFQASTPAVAGTNGNAVAIPAKVTGYKNLKVK
jgi:hypothetical protein